MARFSTDIGGSNRARHRPANKVIVVQPRRDVTLYVRKSAMHLAGQRYLCVLAAFLLLAASAWSQDPQNDIHMTPRTTPATADTPKPGVTDPALKTHTKPLKVEVDLVLVPATVTDPMN